MESCETYLIDPAGEVLEVVDLLYVVRDVARGPVVERARAALRAVKVKWLRLAASGEKLHARGRKVQHSFGRGSGSVERTCLDGREPLHALLGA